MHNKDGHSKKAPLTQYRWDQELIVANFAFHYFFLSCILPFISKLDRKSLHYAYCVVGSLLKKTQIG
jgi:hypothetical protein